MAKGNRLACHQERFVSVESGHFRVEVVFQDSRRGVDWRQSQYWTVGFLGGQRMRKWRIVVSGFQRALVG